MANIGHCPEELEASAREKHLQFQTKAGATIDGRVALRNDAYREKLHGHLRGRGGRSGAHKRKAAVNTIHYSTVSDENQITQVDLVEIFLPNRLHYHLYQSHLCLSSHCTSQSLVFHKICLPRRCLPTCQDRRL